MSDRCKTAGQSLRLTLTKGLEEHQDTASLSGEAERSPGAGPRLAGFILAAGPRLAGFILSLIRGYCRAYAAQGTVAFADLF